MVLPKILCPTAFFSKQLQEGKSNKNIKVQRHYCIFYTRLTSGAARLDGLQPSLKNVRQKVPPNGQTRLKFGFSYENFTIQSFSVLPTPFQLNVS